MKYKKLISILVILIAVLSSTACLAGLLSNSGSGEFYFQSVRGETIELYGKGLYSFDSISVVAQGKASDFITLVFAIPILIISLILSIKGSFRARLLLCGTLGYFLYTYMSYTFLWMYNPFFVVYVALMSASLYAFILCFIGFDIGGISKMFSEKLPARFLGGYQLFVAFAIGMLWLGKIAPSIISGEVPEGLEHYTTLVIQGMDLGFIVPTAILSGILMIRKRPLGFLLSSIIIFKGITMLTAITAMIVSMMLSKVDVNFIELSLFLIFDLLATISLVLLLKNINSNEDGKSLEG